MNNILITIKKELRSMFRDKKTLAALFIYPVMIPLMIILYGQIYDSIDTEINTYNVGIDYEVSEIEESIFKELNIESKKYDSLNDMKKAYEDKDIDAYISYDTKSNKFLIYNDSSTTSGLSTYEVIRTYLEQYNQVLTDSYLVENGINLEEAYNHFEIEDVELSSSNYVISLVMGICLTYIILSICIATSNMAISTTAIERENGTLETLLTFPIKKTELIVGKYLSSVMLGFVAALFSLVLMVAGLYFGKAHYNVFKTFEFVISFKAIMGSLITIIAASLFIAGVALLLTAFSKSYKEAQGQIGILTMIGIVPMFVSILDIELNAFYYLIPICNFQQILNDLFTNSLSLTNVFISLGSTIVYTSVVIFIVIKAYNSEKILFNG